MESGGGEPGGESMIEIRQVSKSFEAIEAIKEISLTIQPRNVFGMLGTNGAGKVKVKNKLEF